MPSTNSRTEAARPPGRPAQILLMDDDPVDLAHYREILQRAGCWVTSCDSHLKALLCLGEHGFDLVLINQGTDRFAWRCVVDSATEHDRRAPVVVLTRSRDMVCQFEAMSLGAADYIEKPATEAQMLEAFRPYLCSPDMAATA
ncbi:MAG TPA: response regulator [Terriglobia bacterium]|nr:response regulator [Terriglobia bacterium]